MVNTLNKGMPIEPVSSHLIKKLIILRHPRQLLIPRIQKLQWRLAPLNLVKEVILLLENRRVAEADL